MLSFHPYPSLQAPPIQMQALEAWKEQSDPGRGKSLTMGMLNISIGSHFYKK